MDEMAVDIEEAGAVFLPVDNMIVEDFVIKGARCAHRLVIHGRTGNWVGQRPAAEGSGRAAGQRA
jgi:hypothetical protein